jgi:lysyl-tRNA synthetase class 1
MACPCPSSWPFEQAQLLAERLKNRSSTKDFVLFETGYGPSGLPHIGTFGEVLRTSMVKYAFEMMNPDIQTRLYCFSDDMDGLRRVPDNLPNQDILRKHLYQRLTSIPDPFGCHGSMGAHNNNQLIQFLNSFGFQFEFQSATDWYSSGRFDETLKKIFHHYDEIMAIMLKSLREERQLTYSPFLPVCPKTGHVLQVPVLELKHDAYTIVYKDPNDDKFMEVPITGGHCKVQWKVDWAMRWAAFEVDFEMSGKDLIDSVKISSQICRVLGVEPPLNMGYELFLDEEGKKISKSKGNGLSMEEWLTYAPQESLAYYLFLSPKRSKRLYFDVIPKAVDEYLEFLKKYQTQTDDERRDNPVFHIHNGQPPKPTLSLSFSLLLNLASVCHAEDPEILWGFIEKYESFDQRPEFWSRLVHFAINYYRDFIKPKQVYKKPNDQEKCGLIQLKDGLLSLKNKNELDSQDIQGLVYEIGKSIFEGNLKAWFLSLYQILLGQEEGPRMGTFIALYGVDKMITKIDEALQS